MRPEDMAEALLAYRPRRHGVSYKTVELALEHDIPILAANNDHAKVLEKMGARTISEDQMREHAARFLVDHHTYDDLIGRLLNKIDRQSKKLKEIKRYVGMLQDVLHGS